MRSEQRSAVSSRSEQRSAVSSRSEELDRVRGAAVVLMIVDHVLALVCELTTWPTNAGPWFARMTITRAALPLFMLLAGALLADRRPSGKRLGQVVAAAVCAQLLVLRLPFMATVNILPVIGWALWVWPRVRGWGVWGVAGCMVFVATLPWPLGYHPGHVLGLMLLGTLLGRAPLERLGGCLQPWAAVVGRRPLAWYLGHLAALWAVWWLLGHRGESDLHRTAWSGPPAVVRMVPEWVAWPGPWGVLSATDPAARNTTGSGSGISGGVITGQTATADFFMQGKFLADKDLPA